MSEDNEDMHDSDRIPTLLMACHDVIRDMLAMRQTKLSEFVSNERLDFIADKCRETAKKMRIKGECND